MNKARKIWLLYQTLTASLFFVFFFYAFFCTIPSASNLHSTGFLPVSPEDTSQESSNPSPVNVYVYRLPRKFTYGVVEHFWRARGFTDSETRGYPSHQHSAEWYLFLDLTTRSHELYWTGSPVIPVSQPEEAEFFYVPFFSSLSSIVNKNQLPSSSDWIKQYDDGKAQEELVAWLEKQEYWTRSEGRDHVLVCQNPKALNRVRDRVKNAVLLVSGFGRVRRDQGSPSKDLVVPCSHRISTYDVDIGVENRRLLLFAGNPYHHGGAKVRDFLFQALENEEDAIIEHEAASQENQVLASERMRSSKFCLDIPPPGSSPASCRLFDAIFSMCIPVIVNGSSIELPFEDVIDYRKIALFVQSTSAVKPAFLVTMLRNVTRDRILEYQQELKLVKRYFDYKDPNGAVKEIWHQVLQKLSLIKLMMINHDNGLQIRCM
ncbi:hypothetical protein F2P56_006495 [Juglans regia]|uniref:Exostosin GT47 domain-containing protein n=2 Tax=Juglans regia TaxID=51240 RepID=A0A834CYD6_JUGRE|nr:probable arabinosyltransferase ARAD1 [Juglans regia]KAF5474609.1 hypothetical protein F2P56_006495 [Juglans regia]